MGRRSGGTIGTQGAIDVLLRNFTVLALLLFVLNALRFALSGAPGVSDIAHLRAIALPFGQLVGWIAGSTDTSLVPAPPHSAPLPLLLDWLIWRALPFGIPGLRIAHLLLALGAITLLQRAVAMRMDQRAALLSALVIALSPRFIEAVTNLGADPYVFVLFSVQLAILLTRGKIGGPDPLLMFTAASAACGLCGITGMLAASSLLAILLFSAPDRSEARRRTRIILFILPVWAFLIYVQITTGAPTDQLTTRWLISASTKLVVHNADLLLLPGAALLVGGMAMLILLGLYSYFRRLGRNGLSERTHPFALLLIGAFVGLSLTFLAGPILRLYAWTEPAAQSWLGLLIALLAAACFTPRLVPATEFLRRLRRIAAGGMVAGAVIGTISYQYRADWFVAGPEAGLSKALEAAGRNRAILYTGSDWGRAYFPHDWLSPDDDDQWLLTLDGRHVQHISPGGRASDPEPLTALDGYDALIVARATRRGWRDLHAVTNTDAIGALPPASLKAFPPQWQAQPAQAAPGEYWLTTQLLEKRKRP